MDWCDEDPVEDTLNSLPAGAIDHYLQRLGVNPAPNQAGDLLFELASRVYVEQPVPGGRRWFGVDSDHYYLADGR